MSTIDNGECLLGLTEVSSILSISECALTCSYWLAVLQHITYIHSAVDGNGTFLGVEGVTIRLQSTRTYHIPGSYIVSLHPIT